MVHFDNNDTNYYYGEHDEESMRAYNIKNSLSHINQLIDMAEVSKGKIANLFKQMKKLRERMFYLIVIAYAGIGFYAAFIKENYNSLSDYLPSLYTLLSLVIAACALTFALYAFLKQRNEIKKQITIERRILKDILSIVFDIRKILDLSDPTGSLWIDLKIVDMRLKRLEFY
ncbi:MULTISPECIES: hypothetical protein [Klebsiella pneumoniae complex]|uniref:hypothetical protein n=1 Tax=Klebsiella pneumoniae complex TaxID=3390273 RepID=UPI000E2B6E43|nr:MULTISPECIES: hypothetical protein [Klebsiella]MBZ6783839.1 hypothetical protein [Klebsiella variicola]MDM9243970.1 hypothetical protein [Klebsiella pneumoniae]SXG86985.1 Uncharacterised protein [Klebsiella variicola]